MSTTSILRNDPTSTPVDTEPFTVSKSSSNPCRKFINTPCFKYTKTVFMVIYGLNIVAWGGMLFLILVGAANKTMPDEFTRKLWIEIDSQILNALFCITGIGLIPWRIRDFYYAYSSKHRDKLFEHHSYTTNICWIRTVVWVYLANSLFQIGMAITMWSLDMYNRPAWLVGLFVGLGFASGAFAGLIQFVLTRKKKRKEKKQIHDEQNQEQISNP